MQNRVITGIGEYVKVVVSSGYKSGDLANEGNFFGVIQEDVEEGKEVVMNIRGVFRLKKTDPSSVLEQGTVVQFVPPGEGETSGKVAAYVDGTKIGKVFETSGAGEEEVVVILMPELY